VRLRACPSTPQASLSTISRNCLRHGFTRLGIAMIESSMPSDWRDLQNRVARILVECGFEVEVEKSIQVARGCVEVDVHATDRGHRPVTTYLYECKHWQRAVPKAVVHAFRTVVADYGANWGLVVSSGGFQSGAFEAAENTNVRLVDWSEFQELYEDRWIEHCLVPRLREEAEPLVDYTEPINTRVFRKANQFDEAHQRRFVELRELYVGIAFLALPLYLGTSTWVAKLRRPDGPLKLDLPLREVLGAHPPPGADRLPQDLLDADCLREFVDVLCRHLCEGVAAFDEVFGGRA